MALEVYGVRSGHRSGAWLPGCGLVPAAEKQGGWRRGAKYWLYGASLEHGGLGLAPAFNYIYYKVKNINGKG
jgi:hypothetical protein